MGAWLIAIIGLLYFGIAVDFFLKGQMGMAITYLGYAIGNVGLYLVAIKLIS